MARRAAAVSLSCSAAMHVLVMLGLAFLPLAQHRAPVPIEISLAAAVRAEARGASPGGAAPRGDAGEPASSPVGMAAVGHPRPVALPAARAPAARGQPPAPVPPESSAPIPGELEPADETSALGEAHPEQLMPGNRASAPGALGTDARDSDPPGSAGGGTGIGGGTGTSTGGGTGGGTGTSTGGNEVGAAPDAESVRQAVQAAILYPRLARSRGLEGTVVLRVHILDGGRVAEIMVVAPADGLLVAEATAAVRRAAPFRSSRGWIRIPIVFALD